jgi:hypothetical protein
MPFHELETLQLQKAAVIDCVNSDEFHLTFVGQDEMSAEDIEETKIFMKWRWCNMVEDASSFDELNKILQMNVVPYGMDSDEDFVFSDRTKDETMNALGHRVAIWMK